MFKQIKEKYKALSKTKRALIRLSTKLVVYGLLIFLLLTFVFNVGAVHDNMNFPSLKDGDLVIVYKLDKYYINDLVAYDVDGKTFYGRIVANGSDVVNISNNLYTVNGLIPYETVYFKTTPMESDLVTYPYTVPDGHRFILGDYREECLDSRVFGAIDESQIKGKVIFIFRSRGM